ncbi:MAG TPA: class I SAM-dependent methyltransferase [Candidatus Binatia bacterium]|jgi:2-polyprenyl-3-methyl-5-hydroxy-6-metoxy-1,4-benzoquinol methylase
MIDALKSSLPADFAAKILRVSSRRRKKLGAGVRRLVDRAYYRTLFGLKITHAPALTRKLAALERQQGRGDAPVPREIWEAQYHDGQWAFLEELEQVTRYSIIAGYIHALARKGALLDVGCGEGILLDRLGARDFSKYVGIDISQTAVELARKKRSGRSTFFQASAEHFVPAESFDAIIFNEVLYYFADPLAVAQRYSAWLRPRGLFISSLYMDSDRARATARLLKRAFQTIDEVKVTSNANTWQISAFAPSRADPEI